MVSLRRIALPVVLGLFCGFGLACFDSCEPPFPPGNHIDKFRILAIQAEPPEVRPNERTTVSFLAVDPKGLVKGSKVFSPSQCLRSGKPADPSAIWVSCLPRLGEGQQGFQACSDFSKLGQRDGGMSLPSPDAGGAALRILFPPCGFRSFWVAPKDFLSRLPPEQQKKGGEAIIVLATLRETLQQISLKTVRVSSRKKEERNTNPKLTGFLLNHKPVNSCRPETKEDCKPYLHPLGKPLGIRVLFDSRSQDTLPTQKGEKKRKEDIVIEWFATGGEFSTRRTVISGENPPRNSPFPTWEATDYRGKRLPDQKEVQIIAVARDGRGGVDWLSVRLLVTTKK